MSASDSLETVMTLLSAASNASDRKMRVIYLAEARVLFDQMKGRFERCGTSIASMESDIVRVGCFT